MQEKISIKSFSESVLYQTIRKLYYASHFCGITAFSYSPSDGIYMKPINYIFFTIITAILGCLIVISATQELTVSATGYKAILLYIGLRFLIFNNLMFNFNISCLTFTFRRWLCQLMEDVIKFESTVCPFRKYLTIHFVSKFQFSVEKLRYLFK